MARDVMEKEELEFASSYVLILAIYEVHTGPVAVRFEYRNQENFKHFLCSLPMAMVMCFYTVVIIQFLKG